MSVTPTFRQPDPEEPGAFRLAGDWCGSPVQAIADAFISSVQDNPASALDLTDVRRMDVAGAWAVLRALGPQPELERVKAHPDHSRLLAMVAEADASRLRKTPPKSSIRTFLERIGKGVAGVVDETYGTLAFAGRLMVVTGRLLSDPRRIRWAPCFSLAERAGLDALPIVTVTTFFIGAVVGLLGVNTLRQFGAEVFAVELIGIAVTREFGIVITAVLLAGRSASAFAAEIGSMRMTQEVDAMRVMGVDPFEALVFPRVAALLLTIPLLTFVATVAGLMGGALVTWSMLGLGPTFFMTRLVESVGDTHFWIALSKAPVMAIAIAGIGCRQGMLVKGDVLSLGQRVTAAVVQAIFAIILIDAVFALIYMELDL
ncbi:MAG: MlaE family ABC transporter permease [Phenylobacterium sp.]|jgi:phospholipid/cholesterol/gamma-HCH transport system permease protein